MVEMGVQTENWGKIGETAVRRFVLESGGLRAAVISYGAALQMLEFAGKDRILGYDTLEGYRGGRSYQGAAIGRYANRIADGRFRLDGREYDVGRNEDGIGHLHGGAAGFDKRVWSAQVLEDGAAPAVRFTLESADGEEGYPGNLSVSLTYRLVGGDTLRLEYAAESDKDTVVNLTNHAYFNLEGADGGDVLDTRVWIAAEAFTPVDARLIPTGEVRPVEGTPFDFRQEKAIGRDIGMDDEQLRLGGGYDHNFVLGFDRRRRHAASAFSPAAGIRLDCFTDQPGMQFYTANGLDEAGGKGGRPLQKRHAFCLETQCFPDSPNHPAFPSPVLKAGERYASVTEYRFSR